MFSVMLQVTDTIAIDESELDESFVRASGPGGQNVNKVATAVQLRFDVLRSQAIADEARQRLRALAGKKMTADGVLVIEARRHRTQARNREDARQRLVELIRRAIAPRRRRRKTMPTAVARQRRLQAKARRAETKRLRTSRPGDE